MVVHTWISGIRCERIRKLETAPPHLHLGNLNAPRRQGFVFCLFFHFFFQGCLGSPFRQSGLGSPRRITPVCGCYRFVDSEVARSKPQNHTLVNLHPSTFPFRDRHLVPVCITHLTSAHARQSKFKLARGGLGRARILGQRLVRSDVGTGHARWTYTRVNLTPLHGPLHHSSSATIRHTAERT
ncbi:hypothetical protein HD554DRAFT_1159758 [Boletus coccyginus]|nr:hypothetical protein HD554DRAFT_1159758 [Boletus coccyginus]